MTFDADILRSLRADPDLSIQVEDGLHIDSAIPSHFEVGGVMFDNDSAYEQERAMDDENHERFMAVVRGVGQARSIAKGLNPNGWSPDGLESVRRLMSEWEYECWIRGQDSTPTHRRLEMDRLIKEGTEAEIAAFREHNARIDALDAKVGSPR